MKAWKKKKKRRSDQKLKSKLDNAYFSEKELIEFDRISLMIWEVIANSMVEWYLKKKELNQILTTNWSAGSVDGRDDIADALKVEKWNEWRLFEKKKKKKPVRLCNLYMYWKLSDSFILSRMTRKISSQNRPLLFNWKKKKNNEFELELQWSMMVDKLIYFLILKLKMEIYTI